MKTTTRIKQEYQDYIINELSITDEPISESLFIRLAQALSEAFNLTLSKAKAIVQSTLKGLYMTNAEAI